MAEARDSACDQTRSLLAARAEGADIDDDAVARHLGACSPCRAFERALQQMWTALSADTPDLPRPDPARLPLLHARVRALRPVWKPWRVLRQALRIRVAAYQVAFGAAAAAVLLFAAVRQPHLSPASLGGQPPAIRREIPAAVPTHLDSYEVVRRMELVRRAGRSPGVDTLLSRHLSRYVRSAVLSSTALSGDHFLPSSQSGPPTGPRRL